MTTRGLLAAVLAGLRPRLLPVIAACLTMLLAGATRVSAADPGPAGKPLPPLARFLTIESPITDEVISWVRTSAAELQTQASQENRKPFLVLEIASGVSEFHQVYGLADLLTSQALSGITSIAWVPQDVTGPNALVALACNEIVMHPDAKLGDLGRGRALPPDQQQIVLAVIAKRNNSRVNEALATAMMDPQSTLMLVSVEVRPGENEKRLATEADARRLREAGAVIRDTRTLKEPGTPGLFSGEQCRQEDIVIVQALASRRELADRYSFEAESLREKPRTAKAAERPVLIEVEGMIEPVLAAFLTRQIDRAVDSGAKTLIFEITSPGGYLQYSIDLANVIADLKDRGVRTIAYVPKEAISGAAIIALGCDEIYLEPDAKIGDAGPIEIAAGGVFERAPEKVLSYLRESLRTLANRKERPPAVAEAMCDKDLDVYEVVHKTKGTVWYMTEDEIHAAGDEWTKGKVVPEAKGEQLLTVNGQRANDLKIAGAPVRDFDDLKARIGIPADVTPQRAQRIWVDDLVFWLNRPAITGLLFFVAIICIYIELHMMSGLLGLVAGFCFILFFWAKWLGGTAGGLEILLFLFGLGCLGMEIFFVPGVGVFGLTGVLSLVASLVLASQTFSLVDQEHSFEDATKTLGTLGISILAVTGVAMTISRYLPQIPFLKDMILIPPGSVSLSDPDQPRLKMDSVAGSDSRIGRTGFSRTLLRPAGKAEIDGRLVDVVSDGSMIAADRPIEIVQVTRNRIVVRERPESA